MNTFSLLLRDFDKRSKVESAEQSKGTCNERSEHATTATSVAMSPNHPWDKYCISSNHYFTFTYFHFYIKTFPNLYIYQAHSIVFINRTRGKTTDFYYLFYKL